MFWLYLIGGVVFVNSLYFLLFTKLKKQRSGNNSQDAQFPVSLIICAKNEAENLKKHIPLWQRQNHPELEIVLINDASYDDTLEIMESFAASDSRIQVVDVQNNEAFWGSKKYALTLGIKRAKSRRMVFTDADCRPASEHWVTLMAQELDEEKQIILGYGGYERYPGLLNILIRFETIMTAVQYMSYTMVGIPYMGVGRNLAYTSNVYYENNGFMSHIQLPSGDDDLFVNQAATPKNVVTCLAPNAFTYSLPKRSFRDWIRQKRRHVSTSKFYKPLHKFLLGTHYLFTLLFWFIAPLAIIFGDWRYVGGIVLFRLLLQYVIIGRAAGIFQEKRLVPGIPIWELFLVLTQLTIFISNTLSRPTHWK